MKIGITGQNGFIGWHLLNSISYKHPEFELVPFSRNFFNEPDELCNFVNKCNVIIHLAGLNRGHEDEFIYKTNIHLAKTLCKAFEKSNFSGKIIFASSIQELNKTVFGKSKKDARKLFLNHSKTYNYEFTGLIIPNVFGSFGKPNYNSFIATFCSKIINQEVPEINEDKSVNLIYIDDLIKCIIDQINNVSKKRIDFESTINVKVSKILEKLNYFNLLYIKDGNIPDLSNSFELNLFNTLRSYIPHEIFYPIAHQQNIDKRGNFSEIIRSNSEGQFSYSSTKRGITRGNHFHTRKIERFSVIKGKAKVEMRKVGTNNKISFLLNGDVPSFVDMPIWYSHNITNTGDDDLITLFWINEPYSPNDSDTYFEIV